MNSMSYTITDSPVGDLLIACDDDALRWIVFQGGIRPIEPPQDWSLSPKVPLLQEALAQLEAYFAGELREFDLPLTPEGTPFQRKVWEALRDIPWGETRSYSELAAAIGRPTASRAVGAANGKNPLPIVIPCHRVIGSTGKLTGFGGGLDVKAGLLRLEGYEGATPEAAPSFL